MNAICHFCGEQWPRHPALASALGEVECPQCGAAIGSGCKRPSDHTGPFVELHAAREQAAVDQGLLELCPASARGEGPTRKGQRSQPTLLDTA